MSSPITADIIAPLFFSEPEGDGGLTIATPAFEKEGRFCGGVGVRRAGAELAAASSGGIAPGSAAVVVCCLRGAPPTQ